MSTVLSSDKCRDAFSEGNTEHKLLHTFTNKKINVAFITPLVTITCLKFIHFLADVTSMAIHFIKVHWTKEPAIKCSYCLFCVSVPERKKHRPLEGRPPCFLYHPSSENGFRLEQGSLQTWINFCLLGP